MLLHWLVLFGVCLIDCLKLDFRLGCESGVLGFGCSEHALTFGSGEDVSRFLVSVKGGRSRWLMVFQVLLVLGLSHSDFIQRVLSITSQWCWYALDVSFGEMIQNLMRFGSSRSLSAVITVVEKSSALLFWWFDCFSSLSIGLLQWLTELQRFVCAALCALCRVTKCQLWL